MKVDPSAIAAIRAKVERAYDHLVLLNSESARFRQRQPYRVEHEIHSKGAKHFLRLRFEEPIPAVWSVILGEAIHDLRSALDQCVYWLTVDKRGRDLSGTQFPIFVRRHTSQRGRGFADSGRGGGLYMLRGVGSGPVAFIEKLQPYPQRGPAPMLKSILALHEFWNQDKHRLVHLWGLTHVGESEISISGARPLSRCIPKLSRGIFHDGAIIARVTCDPPRTDVEVHGHSHLDVAIKDPGKHRRHARVSLIDMFMDVAGVVARLLSALGRQDQAVPLDHVPESDWSWPVKPA